MPPTKVNLGLGTAIINALRRYGKISVTFLADVLGSEPSEVEEFLQVLERFGAVIRSGEYVELVPEPAAKQDA